MSTNTAAQRTWEAALGRLQLQVTRPTFDTWLRDTVGLSLDGRTLLVGVPTTFAAEWLERRMHSLVEDAVAAVAPNPITVAFHVSQTNSRPPADTPPVASTGLDATHSSLNWDLNDHYTFDSFIVGASNQLAHAASMAVADGPGQAFNPLFLYGSVGLGKTHLLHAIGRRATSAGHSVRYVTTEQFTNEFVGAIRERRTQEFRDRYRTIDVLLIDDIQFLSGKEGTQEAFFHTFNALHDAGHQIVITCDRAPGSLPLLEGRLKSRFEWGLLADIGSPDLETRLAILQCRATRSPIPVSPAVLQHIADRVPSNIRQLEGSLNRVIALAELTNVELTVALAAAALGPPQAYANAIPSDTTLLHTVATHFGLPPSALTGRRRDRVAVQARHVAMYLLHHTLGMPPEAIATVLGGRDRTTVLYGIKRITSEVPTSPTLAARLESLVAAAGVSPN